MTKAGAKPPGRKPRADAERNRLRLLETAKAAFAEKGSDASLDEIARSAGVGPGTLYRHFPNRDALVLAVYQNELEHLLAAAERLAAAHPPITALREWLLLFVDYLAAKQGMREVLSSMDGQASEVYASSSLKLKQAVRRLVDGLAEHRPIRLGLEPLDLLRALAGVANVNAGPNGQQAARAMVDLLIAGIDASDRPVREDDQR
ncbi:TetR/AcrR family transcriptional regulator [Pseudoxanthomonas sp. JBR18]|uniref:TetR/AcrR family transcriptional regulator n=1 Tax=Pseudoxanthomonas sp. JBR18 TaxID=2969308 RepID=UPI0023064696|nr:TetR/AcrR family transcriptional regulator [Pseudoxanthomonas sp. JBR18]WCE05894.1 helix-turn-helix domain containing protein [Pseudoxanthomonas sp. JBR18]